MRVAIDATPLRAPTGGIRRYVVELTRALAALFPGDEFHLLSDQPGWQLAPELRDLENVKEFRPAGGLSRSKWWSLGLPWELQRRRIDVFHGSDFTVPYLPLRPSVLTVHDLSPWKKGRVGAGRSARIRQRTPYLLRLATLIVTPTEAVRRELGDAFGVARSRIVVTPLAPTEAFRPVSDSIVMERLRKTGLRQPYLFYLGDRNPRKNLRRLVEAWRQVKTIRSDLGLALVGQPDDDTMEIQGESGLHVFGPLPDEEVRALLSAAVAFVYPSLYEGFGLPVLEAMQAGVPVIASRDPAITEVAGGAALQVDVTVTEPLRRAILDLLTDAQLRARLREQGISRAAQFCWRSSALLTRTAYEEAIRRF